MTTPLQYRVSDLHQLTQCLSNNSRLLHIQVTDIMEDDRLSGVLVSVIDDHIGTLFSSLFYGRGDILSPDQSGRYYEMSVDDLIQHLARYGFIVEYHEEQHIPKPQLEYLSTLKSLGFDKIRHIYTDQLTYGQTGIVGKKSYLVVFNVNTKPGWIHEEYCPSAKEFLEALESGLCLNITDVSASKNFNWTWLTYVASIDDILNSQVRR